MDELLEVSKLMYPTIPSLPSHEYEYKNGEGEILVGASTVAGMLPSYLTKWANDMGVRGYDSYAYLVHSGNIGTVFHKMVEEFLLGRAYTRPKNWEGFEWIGFYEEIATICYQKFLDFLEDYPTFEPMQTEVQLVSQELDFGGTLDIICNIRGKTVLLDLKSTNGFYPSHRLQVGGGYLLLCEEYDLMIDDVMLVRCSREEKENYKKELVQDLDSWKMTFKHMLAIYKQERERVKYHKTEAYKKQRKLDFQYYDVV